MTYILVGESIRKRASQTAKLPYESSTHVAYLYSETEDILLTTVGR